MKVVKLFILVVFCSSISFQSQAARLAKVDGKKAYILLGSKEKIRSQEILNVVDNKGKVVGTVKVLKIKGNKALGLLQSGKAQKGWVLRVNKKSQELATQSTEDSTVNKSSTPKEYPTQFYGLLGGLSQNTMSAQIEQGDGSNKTADMSGSGFSARALMDYSLWTHIWFRGMFGLENFKAEGGNICGAANNTLCSVDISYLSLDLWGRYLFSTGAIRPWVGIGFNLLFPSSKSSTALEEKSITSTSVIAPGGGVDWFLSPDMYIPIQVEYGLYPPSDTVKANNISIRLGIGMHF